MATYRPFQCAFWRDDFVLELSPEEKFFYIYLFTNEQVTMCGIYKLSKKVACFDTGYNLDTINKLIRRFTEYGKIVYSEETQEICLINFIKNNYFTGKKVSELTIKGIQNSLAKVKNTSLINHLQGLEALSIPLISPLQDPCKPLDTPCNDNESPLQAPTYNNNNNKNNNKNNITYNNITNNSITDNSITSNRVTREDNKEKVTGFKTIKSVIEQKSHIVTSTPDGLKQEQVTGNRRRLDIEYEELFEIYPKKTHHDTGFNAYINANATGQLPPFQQLKQAIEEQKQSQQWQNLTYVPSIANWIKQARWKDILTAAETIQSDADREQAEHAKKVEALRDWALANGFKEDEIFLRTTTAAYQKAMGLT